MVSDADAAAFSRQIVWARETLCQGDLLAAFAAHCTDELEDVGVVALTPVSLEARWRSELSRIELRASLERIDRAPGDPPLMLIGDLDTTAPSLIESFLSDGALRESVAIFDPVRLEKLGTVRSSVFVYLEWFLRERYGVKVVPATAFTQGLIERGIIHLGMG